MLSVAYAHIGSQALHRISKMRLRMSFGKRLRQARVRAGLSQDAVGQFFDPPVSRVNVSNWENDRYMPESDKLPRLARGLRVSADYLLLSRANTELGPDVQGKVPLISWVQVNPQYPMLELVEGDVFCGVVRSREHRFF